MNAQLQQVKSQKSLFPENPNSETEFWCEWTDEEIKEIKYRMLTHALDELRDHRRSQQMRKEAWDWLFSDEEAPFSAPVCALEHNLDITEIRKLLKQIVHDV